MSWYFFVFGRIDMQQVQTMWYEHTTSKGNIMSLIHPSFHVINAMNQTHDTIEDSEYQLQLGPLSI